MGAYDSVLLFRENHKPSLSPGNASFRNARNVLLVTAWFIRRINCSYKIFSPGIMKAYSGTESGASCVRSPSRAWEREESMREITWKAPFNLLQVSLRSSASECCREASLPFPNSNRFPVPLTGGLLHNLEQGCPVQPR